MKSYLVGITLGIAALAAFVVSSFPPVPVRYEFAFDIE